MNQLLSCCEGFFLVGMEDTAFLVNCQNHTVAELKQDDSLCPLGDEDSGSESSKKKSDAGNQKTEEDLNEIHSVSLVLHDEESVLYCAVARANKTLSIYQIEIKEGHMAEINPRLVYNTPKRISCSYFTRWPVEAGNHSLSSATPLMLLAGDMAGDAYAYDLETKRQRLLLGHTASMLTGLCMSNDLLLTSDRDEKIRISSFPRTFLLEGFLLGHEAYVTAVDCTADGLVATCGGDSTIRLWNLETQSQTYELSFLNHDEQSTALELIPADLSFNSDGTLLAVIFDSSNRLDIYRVIVAGGDKSERKLEPVHSVSCSSQPLGVCSQGPNRFYVAQTDPHFLASYHVNNGTITEEESKAVKALIKTATDQKIVTLTARLERDQYGQIKLKKLHETRGPSSGDEPWNRSDRVEIAKAANKRHKRRRQEAHRSKS